MNEKIFIDPKPCPDCGKPMGEVHTCSPQTVRQERIQHLADQMYQAGLYSQSTTVLNMHRDLVAAESRIAELAEQAARNFSAAVQWQERAEKAEAEAREARQRAGGFNELVDALYGSPCPTIAQWSDIQRVVRQIRGLSGKERA